MLATRALVHLLSLLLAVKLLGVTETAAQECACGSTSSQDGDYELCDLEDVLTDKIDGNNQVICQQYVKQNIDGDVFCTFRSPENTNPQPLPRFNGRNYINFRMFDPNQLNSSCCYPPQLFCGYNVQCRTGDVLYYRIVRADQQNKDSTGRCIDELTILRESHSMRELITCGRNGTLQLEEMDASAPRSGEEFDKLKVRFYTSRHCHNCGFLIFVFCVNVRNTYNQPGCNRNIQGPRGKRDTLTSNATLHPRGRRHRFRSFSIRLRVGSSMTYQSNTLRIFRGRVQLKRLPGIRVLQVFDTVFRYANYYGSTNITFNGFGTLWIGHRIVQYIQEGVRPELKPSQNEEDTIELLLRALAGSFPNDSISFTMDDIDIELNNNTQTTPIPTAPLPSATPPKREKRQAAPPENTCPVNTATGSNTCLFVGATIGKRSTTVQQCAMEAAQSCNGIARSVGRFFIVQTGGTPPP